MKIYKIVFLLILFLSSLNSSMAMEPDSSDENHYNENTRSVGDIKSDDDYNAKFEFAFFTKLPPELQYEILYLDLTSILRGNKIRKRALTLSSVCKLLKDHLVAFKKEEIWRKLLEVEAHVKGKKSNEIVNELIRVAKANDIEYVKFLILGNACNAKNNFGNTALTYAAHNGHTEMVKILIAAGVDLEAKNKHGDTALNCAAFEGFAEIIKILIVAGADPNSKDRYGDTVLIRTVRSGYTKIVKMLIDLGVDLAEKNNSGNTALIRAAKKNCAEIIKALIGAGVDINAPDDNGDTALLRAVKKGYIVIVEMLIDAGADINSTDNEGNTAFTWASWNAYLEVLNLLNQNVKFNGVY